MISNSASSIPYCLHSELRLASEEFALIRILLFCLSLLGTSLAALLMQTRQSRSHSYAPPPRSIVICGAQDYACVTYVISYHPATHAFTDSLGEGVIDYERKTISIVWRNDPFKNVEALEREVFQAALWERGIRDNDKLAVHEWIYFSEGTFALLFHDNPEFANYVTAGY